jgi:hypothetical protein
MQIIFLEIIVGQHFLESLMSDGKLAHTTNFIIIKYNAYFCSTNTFTLQQALPPRFRLKIGKKDGARGTASFEIHLLPSKEKSFFF